MKTDKELDFLEEHIPELANSAIKKAYLDTLSAGLSVTKVIENNHIISFFIFNKLYYNKS